MDDFLFIILGDKPHCHLVSGADHEIVLNGKAFTTDDEYGFTGFYDWLRNLSGEVIGVRYIRFDTHREILNAVNQLSYISVSPNEIMEIYFIASRNYVDKNSNDQDFGDCKIYLSENSTFAIVLDIVNLAEDERASIPLKLYRLNRKENIMAINNPESENKARSADFEKSKSLPYRGRFRGGFIQPHRHPQPNNHHSRTKRENIHQPKLAGHKTNQRTG